MVVYLAYDMFVAYVGPHVYAVYTTELAAGNRHLQGCGLRDYLRPTFRSFLAVD